jgi:Uma2 family endonuclease
VSFVRRDRLPAPDARGFYRGAPALAIEVLSPDDRAADVQERVDDYLAAGTPMVVAVDPEQQRVSGFQVRVSEIFE